MILETKTEEIFHKNGQLSYRATIGILSKSHAHLYSNRRTHPDGYDWIYVGTCGKWKDNGKQKWVLNYSQTGEILK